MVVEVWVTVEKAVLVTVWELELAAVSKYAVAPPKITVSAMNAAAMVLKFTMRSKTPLRIA